MNKRCFVDDGEDFLTETPNSFDEFDDDDYLEDVVIDPCEDCEHNEPGCFFKHPCKTCQYNDINEDYDEARDF